MADLSDRIIKYDKGNFKIVWKPGKCSHSGICAAGLPGVFQPRERPWIKPEGAEADEIIAQVGRCPSGALSIEKKEETGS